MEFLARRIDTQHIKKTPSSQVTTAMDTNKTRTWNVSFSYTSFFHTYRKHIVDVVLAMCLWNVCARLRTIVDSQDNNGNGGFILAAFFSWLIPTVCWRSVKSKTPHINKFRHWFSVLRSVVVGTHPSDIVIISLGRCYADIVEQTSRIPPVLLQAKTPCKFRHPLVHHWYPKLPKSSLNDVFL